MLLIVIFAVCAFGGGTFRSNAPSLLYVRPIIIGLIVALLLSPGRWNFRPYAPLFALLAAFAATLLVQLIPLPPAIWQGLPGRSAYIAAAELTNSAQPWRPISLMPDGTINALLSLLPPLAILLALSGLEDREWRLTPYIVLALALSSAAIGVAQFLTGGFFFYASSDTAFPIGFLANHNHQAMLLVIGMILIRYGSPSEPRQTGGKWPIRRIVALLTITFLTLVVLLTASRAGLAALGLFLMADLGVRIWRAAHGDKKDWMRVALFSIPLLVLVVGAIAAQQSGYQRILVALDGWNDELRLRIFPTLINLVREFWILGSGGGSFDRIFFQYEPDDLLSKIYINHAHNELLELIITGGVPAIITLAAFLIWYVQSGLGIFKNGDDENIARIGLAGSFVILLLLGASLVDYPLRTPLMSIVFTAACAWVCRTRTSAVFRRTSSIAFPIQPL